MRLAATPGEAVLLEPAVTLTDYLLALECAWLAGLIARGASRSAWRSSFVVLFAAAAAGALFGGTVHGFFPDAASPGNRLLWTATLLCIGMSAAAMVAAGCSLLAGDRVALKLLPLWVGVWAAYALYVAFVRREFVVAIMAYLPAALFLLGAFAARWRAGGRDAGWGIVGILLGLLAAVLQQAGVGLHPVHFDHNAVYHVFQGVALYLLFRTALGIGRSR